MHPKTIRVRRVALLALAAVLVSAGSVSRLPAAPAATEAAPPVGAPAVQQALLAGRAVNFNDQATEATRTVPAAWVRDAVVRGVEVDLRRAILAGPLDLRGVTANAPVRLDACTLSDHADLGNARFRRGLGLSGATFRHGISLNETTVEGGLNLHGANFAGGAVEGVALVVQGALGMPGAVFQEGVSANFQELRCHGLNARRVAWGGETRFDGARVQGAAHFAGAGFRRAAGFRGVHFEREADFSGHDAGSDAPPADFHGSVDFRDARFDGGGHFHGVTFHGGADFGRARLGTAGFREVHFGGPASFEDAVILHRAAFGADAVPAAHPAAVFTGTANFRGVRFHGDADFVGVRFRQAVDFGFSQAERGLTFGGTAGEPAAAVFDGAAGFEGLRVVGPADFRRVRFGGKTDFRAARLDGEARFGDTEFADRADFAHARFAAVGDFTGTRFGAGASFRDATLRVLQFQGDEPPAGTEPPNARFEGPVDLRGCVYERLRVGSPESLTARLEPLDRAARARLERALDGVGEEPPPPAPPPPTAVVHGAAPLAHRPPSEPPAEEAGRAGGDAARPVPFLNRAYAELLGRGVSPWRVGAVTMALLAAGTVCLSRRGWVLRRDPGNPHAPGIPVKLNARQAFVLSVRLFLPVNLPIGTQWQPATEKAGDFPPPRSAPLHAAAIVGAGLTILGWLLVPLGVVLTVGRWGVDR